VQIQLGEMAAFATIVESMILAQEAQATIDAEGTVWPSKAALYATMALQSEINPRLMDIARELAGGSIIMLPSSVKDFQSPEVAADPRTLCRLAGIPIACARGRVEACLGFNRHRILPAGTSNMRNSTAVRRSW